MSLWFVALLFLGREKGCEERESRKFPHHHPSLINVIQVQAEGAGDQIPEQGQALLPPQVCVVYMWGH